MATYDVSNGNGRFTLRLTLTEGAYSVANNTSPVNYTLSLIANTSYNFWGYSIGYSVTLDGVTVASQAKTGSYTLNGYSSLSLCSGTATISHNSDGTKTLPLSFSIQMTSADHTPGNLSKSDSMSLTTIPRASTIDSLTCSTSYLDGTFTYKYTPKSASFYNRLRVSIPGVVALGYVQLGQKSTSQQTGTYTLSSALLESIYNRYPNTSKASIGFVIETYTDSGYSSKVGESTEPSVSLDFPTSVKPSCDFTYSDTTSCYSTYGKFVQNNSALSIAVSTTLAYGSSIKSYSVQVDGKTYTSQNVTTDILIGTGTKNIVVSVTDARGRTSASVTKSINILEYSAPVVTLTAERCTSAGTTDPEGAYMKLSISGTISSLDNQNSATYEIKYKKASDESYTTLSGSGTSFTSNVIACAVDYIWNVEGRIIDEITTNPTPRSTNIPIAFVLMDFRSTGKGIAFGKVSTQDGFECSMDANFTGAFKIANKLITEYLYPVGSIYLSVNNTDPSTLFGGTWVQLKDRFLLGAGDTYSNGATGGSASLQSHTHRIPALSGTAQSNGAHTHTIKGLSGSISGAGACVESFGSAPLATRDITDAIVSNGAHTHSVRTNASTSGSTGAGDSGNMPPYLVVYMWKRTA